MHSSNEALRDIPFFQACIDSQNDILIFSIDRSFQYRTFNKAFQSATSYAYGTDVRTGMNLLESITDPNDRIKAKSNCDKAFAGESHHTLEEYGTIHPAVYETHYRPVYDGDGSVIGVTVMSSNVTERVVAEQRLNTLNKELESFTYSAAHDLRVPLRVINGYSRILSEDYRDALDEEGKKLVNIIVTQSTHMGRLIDDLLTFAQLGKAPVNLRSTQMRDIAQQAIDEQVPLFPYVNARFTIGDLPACNCDPSLMRIVFSNLISNAIKFSSRSGNPVIDIGAKTEGNEVIYFVRDNGIGFNMEYSGKLFGLFQRLHKQGEYEGTGVGLAAVQRILGKHGGKVWFESEPGKGATFFFSL